MKKGERMSSPSQGSRSLFSHWLAGVQAGFPIVLGYFPVAVAFGMAARSSGLSGLQSVVTSAVLYAGASQFALVGLLGAGEPPLVVGLTALALNVRHIFYGPVLAPLLQGLSRGWRMLLAYGLTDEVFAAAAARMESFPPHERPGWLWGLSCAAYGSWLLGTWVGTTGGGAIMTAFPQLGQVLSFALPVLFLVLLLPLLKGPAVVTALATAGATLPFHLMGKTGMGLAVGVVAGLVAGLLWEAKMSPEPGEKEGI